MSKALLSCLLHPAGIAPAPIEYPILYSIVCTVKAKKIPLLKLEFQTMRYSKLKGWNFMKTPVPC